ncbi:glycoside hydrolase family 88 protein [Formosa sp. PL04]|uniref:glycoside hydrolase family 88 protein n=1 Tax=Formosa sp. PL04 TaxID=3081755 RepID=UPI002980B04E|nr:glycoside hydrolase family 88 protein [Formosa sp. PL04]MDW5290935.1 glycoside hydrolase family 88 protein [Formosa sp. PL04]
MTKFNYFVLVIGLTFLFTGCKSETKNSKESSEITLKTPLEERFKQLLDYPVGADSFPRSMSLNPVEIHTVPSKDWTSGFFPGNLWQIYHLTGDTAYITKAKAWTALMENQKENDRTHDMGFKIYCSFGEGLKVEPDNKAYKDVIVESAKTLITRYDSNVKSIRSWDFNKDVWDFPVIIDNMMNLELLFESTKITGDSTYYNIAVQHANTTLKNQFRADGSVYHVVNYDTISGDVKTKDTHQGFNTNSSWARGQGWAIYGYTMCYRYTKDPAYLAQAEHTIKFYMEHENLPEDGIPYWDFNDPDIPNSPRDASAASLITSALFELYSFTEKETYLDFANGTLNILNSDAYLLNDKVMGPFLLNHSTGNWPKNDEIDEPIVYADYYFLEALLREQNLNL